MKLTLTEQDHQLKTVPENPFQWLCLNTIGDPLVTLLSSTHQTNKPNTEIQS